MPFNGSGTYSLASGNPVVTGTTISSTWANTTLSDIATGLTTAMTKDGQSTATANIPLGGFKLTGVGLATARTDAASIANMQNQTGLYVSAVGGSADVITLTPSPAITVYAAGQVFSWIASGANTTNVTVNVSGVGAKALTRNGTTALIAGDILSGSLISAQYDGAQFQLLNPIVHDESAWTAWTPALGGTASYTARVGRYKKVGRKVDYFGSISVNLIGSGSASVISGLPVAAASLGCNQSGSVSFWSGIGIAYVYVGIEVVDNTATLAINGATAAANSMTPGATFFNNNAVINFSGTYEAAS